MTCEGGSQLTLCLFHVGCGGLIKGISGYAKTPNYPNAYPPNQDCRWTMYLPSNYHVQVTDVTFDLPSKKFIGAMF